MKKLLMAALVLAACLILFEGRAVSGDSPQPVQTPSQFVSEFYGNFYAGYLKYMNSRDRKLGDFRKLFEPRNYFSDRLSAYLIDEERIQLAHPGELTSLDFDPFINAQDDVGKPIIGEAKAVGKKTHVKVTFSTYPDHQVIYEITTGPKGMIISNILYPDPEGQTDLLKLFAEHKKNR